MVGQYYLLGKLLDLYERILKWRSVIIYLYILKACSSSAITFDPKVEKSQMLFSCFQDVKSKKVCFPLKVKAMLDFLTMGRHFFPSFLSNNYIK